VNKIIQMAESHLQNVSKAISDLSNKKDEVEEEINKLKAYLEEGLKEVELVKQSNSN